MRYSDSQTESGNLRGMESSLREMHFFAVSAKGGTDISGENIEALLNNVIGPAVIGRHGELLKKIANPFSRP